MEIIRRAAPTRVFVPADKWETDPGTDFILLPGDIFLGAGTGANDNPRLLSDNSWTATAMSQVAGAGADFLSTADVGVPKHWLTNASGDLLQSPAVFGDDAHAKMAEAILGYAPTRLVVTVNAAFSVHSANETRTGFGLVEAGGTAGTDADAMAWIHTDATNFTIRSAADSDVGAADDAVWHIWEIVFSIGTTGAIEWFIDGTSQGTFDLQTDLWPCSFGLHALTTNRVLMGPVHIRYE